MGLPSSAQIIEDFDLVLDELKIVYCAHNTDVEVLADQNRHIRRVVGDGKSGRLGGARSKCEGRECGLDKKIFLNRYLLKLCPKQNLYTTKLFPYTIVFLYGVKSCFRVMG